MATHVALLYSVVLGKGRRVVMSELRDMAESIGLRNPRTLVATGNLLFDSTEASVAILEQRLERAFAQAFGRHVDIIVREAGDWVELAAGNPFPAESAAAADQVVAQVMRHAPHAEAVTALDAIVTPNERIEMVGRDLWIVFSRDRPNSRLLAGVNHKRLGIGTSRNWNTIRKLAEMIEGGAARNRPYSCLPRPSRSSRRR